MSCLIKKNKRDYYSRVSVRVGDRQSNKRKDVYIKLDTYKYSFAKKRNAIVTREENKIRLEIKKGYATKSDLLNINELVEWEWLKECGLTSMKIHTLKEYVI